MNSWRQATRTRTVLPAILGALATLLSSGLAPVSTARGGTPVILEWIDPSGDDDGPGSYTYPTSQVYKPGSFDLTRVRLVPEGDQLEVWVEFAVPVEDPWGSAGWSPPGHGFSLQLAFVFLDVHPPPRAGHAKGLPGLNVRFGPEAEWDKVIVISPQANARLEAEAKQKVPDLISSLVLPSKVRVTGKTIIASVPLAVVGKPQASWGIQVLVQSNEGYPDPTEFLTRRVDAKAGLHHFGGGRDGECDPHVIDMLTAPGRGTPTEIERQHDLLLNYSCEQPASLPLIRLGSQQRDDHRR